MGAAGDGCGRLWLTVAVQYQLQLQRQELAMAVAGNGGESLRLVLGSGCPLKLGPLKLRLLRPEA